MPTDPNPEWEHFAAHEPYFAVLTAPEYLRQNLTPERRQAFRLASGACRHQL